MRIRLIGYYVINEAKKVKTIVVEAFYQTNNQ